MSSDIITPQLDPKFYTLAENEAAFFKAQTGIEDEATLKNHIFTIQEGSVQGAPLSVHSPFRLCKVEDFEATVLSTALEPRKRSQGSGLCRHWMLLKAVADGFPVEQVIASDLHPEFWELGHRLFKSTAETFPARFIPADIFQLKGLTKEDAPSSIPELFQVQSLAELRGNISAIHTSSFFHLFDEEGQFEIAKIMAALLSSEPGSMIFGLHGGRQEKGLRTEVGLNSGRRSPMFCHSPESWKSLWDGEIYPKGTVRVDAFLHEHDHPEMIDSGAKSYLLVWCITVL
ncbi:uncharacterized protein EV420DRAFT_1645209 [Desarmillaria tabescens]|uniref:Uncharacterized protein n=1 Tax=Armillaria tabescens TaxID=1929756 RepID=A0AA39K862_ARMTA|nr:uncharacterized protein EV420DRAFT_1645209 [Desarmillaria tabescens]KAK0453988.1 hypothetical protein EV420DRAFT_1645209 [Desarmillaria tabescens]